MTFTVTYRDKTGAKRDEVVEAASRAECAAACRVRGISPLAIREGANGRKGLKSANGDKGSNGVKDSKGLKGLKGVLSALSLLALLGDGAWWWLGRIENGKLRIENPESPSEVPSMPKGGHDGDSPLQTC